MSLGKSVERVGDFFASICAHYYLIFDTSTLHTELTEEEGHSGVLGNVVLVSGLNGVPKKRRNEYEQP
jgi:hypothetical protein